MNYFPSIPIPFDYSVTRVASLTGIELATGIRLKGIGPRVAWMGSVPDALSNNGNTYVRLDNYVLGDTKLDHGLFERDFFLSKLNSL